VVDVCDAVVQCCPYVVIFVTEQAQDCVVVQTVIQIEVPEAMSFAVDGVYAIQDCTYHEYGIIGHDGAVHPLFLQLCINVCFPGGDVTVVAEQSVILCDHQEAVVPVGQ
jgi:hypothetical protein